MPNCFTIPRLMPLRPRLKDSAMAPRLPLERSSRHHSCDLCDGTHFEVIAHLDRHRRPLGTVICRQCGCVSHEQIPDDQALDRYYRVDYRHEYHGEISPAPHRVLRAWEGGQWLFKRLQPYVPIRSRVCEIGAGIGCTVKVFQLAGYDAEGIEPGVGFHRFAEDRLRARIQQCNLSDLPARPTYDFVLLVHVIEHFNSPRRALQHIHGLLHEDGQLYVECPNLGAPHAAPGKQFHFAHIHNFTPDTLEMLAHRCGFDVVARLSGPRDRALRVILRRNKAAELRLVPESYQRTLEALDRYSRIGYHLRPSYWLDRLHRDARFVSHHLWARQRLNRILRRCAETAGPASPGRRAAS